MRALGIRHRILLAVLGPAILVAILVTGLLVARQMQQAEQEQHRRLAAVARQLAALAEYNLFVGNVAALEKLLPVARQEPDVMAAAFLTSQGKVLASTLPAAELPTPDQALRGFMGPRDNIPTEHWHSLPIRGTELSGTDLYAADPEHEPPLLGYLLLKISTQALHEELRSYAFNAAALSSLMLFLGLLLALGLSQGLIRTLTDIGRVVEGIGKGQYNLRVDPVGKDELGSKLAEGINAMAAAVDQKREELADKVLEATVQLRHERDEASHAAQARSRFFAAASHDLRQPAQALGLFVARLQRESDRPENQPKLRQLAQAVDNLQGLLATLLDYSRLDGQVFRVEARPVHASQAIAQVVDSFAAAASEKHLSLRMRVADCWLMTDPALLHRILINLIGNAVRHTRRGGVLVACRRGQHQARIEVWDTGPGIPPESQSVIFDELVQLDNPERDAEKGLGLGLAIVRKSAELLGHPLQLRSRVDHGSCFSLRIPLTQPAIAVESVEGRDLPEGGPVLLIGPPSPEVNALAALLESWQFVVERADDADTARTYLAGETIPQLAILDFAEGAAGIAKAIAWLNRIAMETGHDLPALIVGSGPVPALGEQPGAAPRLLLARPFRPARLRALINRLRAHHDDLPD